MEVLVSTYGGHGDRPGSGHKHALQAISLLASSRQRFNVAIDLFFDLVDRFCSRHRGQGLLRSYGAAYTDALMQNYDQIFVRQILSRHWPSGGIDSCCNMENALQRIDTLKHDYEFRDTRALSWLRDLGLFRNTPSVFCDSIKVLRSMQRRRTSDAWKARVRRSGMPTYHIDNLTRSTWRKSLMTATDSTESSSSHGRESSIQYAYGSVFALHGDCDHRRRHIKDIVNS